MACNGQPHSSSDLCQEQIHTLVASSVAAHMFDGSPIEIARLRDGVGDKINNATLGLRLLCLRVLYPQQTVGSFNAPPAPFSANFIPPALPPEPTSCSTGMSISNPLMRKCASPDPRKMQMSR